jgi:Icc protein
MHAQATIKSIILALCCLIVCASHEAWAAEAVPKPYSHLVVLGDPHLPGKHLDAKESAIRKINSWADVDRVVAVGDLCENVGDDGEYAAVKHFFEKLRKPLSPIVGNHDFIYSDFLSAGGMRLRALSASREAKLRKFRETFGLPSIYYSKMEGDYLLVFLSTDGSGYLAEISDQQTDWLKSELEKNQNTPTVIFFHAPLKGTLRDYDNDANTSHFVAQPSGVLHEILVKNPQVFLWVSGHKHTTPEEESFASPINVYASRITNIHNADMNRETIWTNSLFLYPDKVVVRTYQHKQDTWLPAFDRIVSPLRLNPALSIRFSKTRRD